MCELGFIFFYLWPSSKIHVSNGWRLNIKPLLVTLVSLVVVVAVVIAVAAAAAVVVVSSLERGVC